MEEVEEVEEGGRGRGSPFAALSSSCLSSSLGGADTLLPPITCSQTTSQQAGGVANLVLYSHGA